MIWTILAFKKDEFSLEEARKGSPGLTKREVVRLSLLSLPEGKLIGELTAT